MQARAWLLAERARAWLLAERARDWLLAERAKSACCIPYINFPLLLYIHKNMMLM